MKAYLAIKFKEDFSNRNMIEDISNILKKSDIETVVMARDFEKWGEIKSTPKKLMRETFKEIDSSDIIVIEFSEKGVGLGIEAGYAYAKQKPIFVIAKNGSDISSTLEGIAKEVIFYDHLDDLVGKIII
jgi:2'-deoxynucleoside 5'-phosphate N-hydrolase